MRRWGRTGGVADMVVEYGFSTAAVGMAAQVAPCL